MPESETVAVDAPAGAGAEPVAGERLCGLLVDWGGVLTTNVFGSFDAFCEREGLEAGVVRHAFVNDGRAREALVGLELGTLPEPEFETRMAGVLGVDATNLIERLMGGAGPDLEMLAVVRRARDHGIATGLISNSWGASRYDAELLGELFDGVVISATVGVRKPAPEIYKIGARSLHLQPKECVFVDDLRGNLKPARALGMTTVHHVDAATTIAQLSDIFGIDLR
ncbi:MAG TPA: HAD family phosphatase [Micromonosporaceae bacterium]|jgi:epoxide hydrolase-like predicted phosphatase